MSTTQKKPFSKNIQSTFLALYQVSYVSAGVPVFPNFMRPTLTKIGAVDISIAWSLPDDRGSPVLGFVVMQDINGANNWQVLYNGTADPNIFQTAVYGLLPEQIYSYRVYAVNRVGTSSFIGQQIQISQLMSAPQSRATTLPSRVQSNSNAQVRVQSVDPISGADERSGGRLFVL